MTHLKSLRLAAGLTQAELAATLGIPQQNYSRYETGQYDISKITLARALILANALGVEPRDLISPDPS